MKNIVCKVVGLAVGVTMALLNGGCSSKYLQNPNSTKNLSEQIDLSSCERNKDTLAKIYLELSYNSDSSILAGHIFPEPEIGFKGDSLVFKFDKKGNLIGRERYYGSDLNNIYFKNIILRNKKGRIKSIISRVGEPLFKPLSNLFSQAEGTKKEKKLYEGKTNILLKDIKTKYFRYNSKTKNYYLRNKK